MACSPATELPEWIQKPERREQRGGNQRSPSSSFDGSPNSCFHGLLLPSPLGKSGTVENECILVRGERVAKTRHLCLSCWGPALVCLQSGKEMERKRRMEYWGCCRSMAVPFNLRKRTKMKPSPIAAKIWAKFRIWSAAFRTVFASLLERAKVTDQFVVMMPLSGLVCGYAHTPVRPDHSISRVHCCKCWLTWNAQQVRGWLSPSRSVFCLHSATAWKHVQLQTNCTQEIYDAKP